MGLLQIYRSSAVGRVADWSSLGQIAFGFASFCGGGALLTWVASTIEPVMHYGWGAAVFAGLGAVCFSVLVLSVAAFALRPWLPVRSQGYDNPLIQKESIAQRRDITDDLTRIQTQVESVQYVFGQKLADFDQRFGSFSAAIGGVREKTEALFKLLEASPQPKGLPALGQVYRPGQNRLETIDTSIQELRSEYGSISASIRSDLEKISLEIHGLSVKHDRFVDHVTNRFRATATEYDLDRCFDRLKPITDKLFQPSSSPERPVDWGAWSDLYREWQSRVRAICAQARPYIDLEKDILTINSDDYRSGKWNFDNSKFPDEDQILEYKDFCLRKSKLDLSLPVIRESVMAASRS